MNEQEFRGMCERHDLTYEYSDDSRVWNKGRAEVDAIVEASKALPMDVVERVWNAEVDRKIVPEARKAFYWRWPKVEAS